MTAFSNNFDRRVALAMLASGLAVATTGCKRQHLSALRRGSHVVVVGAGVAGLAATELLLKAGFKVDLVEASDRTGGRVRTVDLGNQHVDLGGVWLHDGTTNYLRKAAEAQRVARYRTDWNNGITLSHDRPVAFDTQKVVSEFEDALQSDWLSYTVRSSLGLSTRSESLEKAVGQVLNQSGAQGNSLRALLETNFAAPLNKISASSMFGPTLPGNDGHNPLPSNDVVTQNGMASFIASLTPQATASASLNEPVHAITKTAKGVQVATSRRIIEADAVIVTVSIGVLKSDLIAFAPGLPAAHQAALDRIEMGASDKLYMLFAKDVDLPDSHILTLCDNDPFGIVVNFQAIAGRPLIGAFTTGAEALNYRGVSKEDAGRILLQKLEIAYQRKLPSPLATTTSDWMGDPWIRGAYAYHTVAADGSETETLRTPISERIFLAGEAISDRSGLVDGAWHDGRRAASLIALGS